MQHFNKLTPDEAERLALLLEEIGEVQQIVGKILRHGYNSHKPGTDPRITNRSLLESELGDVQFAIYLLMSGGDISEDHVAEARRMKAERIWQYMHHNGKAQQPAPAATRPYARKVPFEPSAPAADAEPTLEQRKARAFDWLEGFDTSALRNRSCEWSYMRRQWEALEGMCIKGKGTTLLEAVEAAMRAEQEGR